MVKFINIIMFKYKYLSICLIGILISLLFLIAFFSNKSSFELFLGCFIGYTFISMAINNVRLGLFESLKKDSSDGEVIGRGILIVVSLLFLLIIIIQELFK